MVGEAPGGGAERSVSRLVVVLLVSPWRRRPRRLAALSLMTITDGGSVSWQPAGPPPVICDPERRLSPPTAASSRGPFMLLPLPPNSSSAWSMYLMSDAFSAQRGSPLAELCTARTISLVVVWLPAVGVAAIVSSRAGPFSGSGSIRLLRLMPDDFRPGGEWNELRCSRRLAAAAEEDEQGEEDVEGEEVELYPAAAPPGPLASAAPVVQLYDARDGPGTGDVSREGSGVDVLWLAVPPLLLALLLLQQLLVVLPPLGAAAEFSVDAAVVAAGERSFRECNDVCVATLWMTVDDEAPPAASAKPPARAVLVVVAVVDVGSCRLAADGGAIRPPRRLAMLVGPDEANRAP